jgi:uncharacterized membrane protein
MVYNSKNLWKFSLCIVFLAYFFLTLTIGLSYHWGYLSSLVDLGTFDQAVWGTLHGHFFLNTHNDFNVPINYLGIHFRPILSIFLPFYALLPKAEWMVIAQSLALSIAVWPIYMLARIVNQSEAIAFFWSIAYMANPFVFNISPWIFRPESLAVPFIAIAFLSIEESKFNLLLLACLLTMLCKEHFGIMVIGFGFLWWMRTRRWKQAIILVSFGMVYSILVLGVIMPALSPLGKHVMIGKGLGQISRYSWLGDSMKGIIKNVLFHPIFVIKTVVLEFGGASYLLLLFALFLGFPLAAPEFLFPGMADLAANLLSANPMPRSPFSYHSVSLIPVFIVAAIYGVRRIAVWNKKFSAKELAGFSFIACIIGGYFLSPLPLPGARNDWAPVHFINLPDNDLRLIQSLIGEKASVSAQSNVGSHLSQRKEIYRYPNRVGEVDVILLRLKSPTQNINNLPEHQSKDRKYITSILDAHLQMDRIDYIASIESILSQKKYGVLFWKDPWLVFSKNAANRKPVKLIEQKLNQLKKEWQIKS